MSKRIYGKWLPEDMRNAINDFKEEKMGVNEVCRKYEIPKKTFLRHLNGEVKRGIQCERGMARKVNGRNTALPFEVEKELVKHILLFEEMFFGMTIFDVRKLAFDILEANPHISNPFSKKTCLAGKKWYYSFLGRHPTISLRQPESISLARCRGFSKTNVHHFFDVLEKIVDENKFDSFHIYNVDESGFSTVQKRNSKIIARKGKHQVGAISSGERGINTTLVACLNAAGHVIPPMIIFKRQRNHPALGNGAPPGSLIEVSESGYINSELFLKWLQHFINFVKPSVNEKVLLVLDGHTTHSKNLAAIKLARANGVVLLQLPGHTTHRLQPLDVSVFSPMETYYHEAIRRWMRANPGGKITQFDVAGLLREAYEESITLKNAASGFRATGIWPVNRTVFQPQDFIASENLEEPVELAHEENNAHVNPIEPNEEVDVATVASQLLQDSEKVVLHEENMSNVKNDVLVVPLKEISPLPKQSKTLATRKLRGAQKAVLLTSSPYKDTLEGKQNKVTEREKTKTSNETQKRKTFNLTTERRVSKRKLKFDNETIVIDVNENDWYCIVCEDTCIENMHQCQMCKKWAHDSCAGVQEKTRNYVCCLCIE